MNEYDTDTPLEELSDEALVNMSEEEIQLRVKLMKAEEGVPILSMPEKPMEPDLPPPDGNFWETNIFDGFLFKSVEDIQEARQLFEDLVVCKKHSPYHGPDIFTSDLLTSRYGSGRVDFAVNPVSIRSREQLGPLGQRIAASQEANEIYRKEQEKYDTTKGQTEDIEKSIRQPIQEAHSRQYARGEATMRMKEYLSLSKGDFAIALGFYRKAYSPERYVIEHLCSSHSQLLPQDLLEELDGSKGGSE